MLNVGFDSFISVDEIVAILPYAGTKLQKEVTARKKMNETEKSWLLDCTRKNAVKSVIVCKNGLYVLSANNPKTLTKRFNKIKQGG